MNVSDESSTMTATPVQELGDFQAVQRVQRFVQRLFGVMVPLTGVHGDLYVPACDPQLHPYYCRQMQKQPGGRERCVECDVRHLKQAAAKRRTMRYNCHGGVREVIAPILVDTEVVAFFFAGGWLNAKPTEARWSRIAKALAREKLDPEPLKEAFFKMRVMSPQREDELVELLEICAAYIGAIYRHPGRAGPPRRSEIVRRAEEYIKAHYTESISLDDVASASCTTKRNLGRLFRKEVDTTVLAFILSLRVARAARLLRTTQMSCTEIAFQSGFSSIRQFNRAFKEFKEMTPKAWQEL